MYAYLGAAIFYLLSVIVAGFYGMDIGKDVEKSFWHAEVIKQKESFEKELSAAMERVQQVNDSNHAKLVEVINETDQRNKKLQSDIDLIDAQRMFVTTKAENCERNLSSKAKDNSKYGGGAGRVELSDEDAENIRRDYYDAQRVVNQYLACRSMLIKLVDVE